MVAALWAASRVLHPILDTQFSIFYHLVCVENFKCKNRFSARMCLSPIVTLIFFCFITYFFFHFSYVLSLVFIANPSGKPLKMCSSYERTQEHSTLMPHRIRFTRSLSECGSNAYIQKYCIWNDFHHFAKWSGGNKFQVLKCRQALLSFSYMDFIHENSPRWRKNVNKPSYTYQVHEQKL